MNPADVRAQLEDEWSWRSDEVRFLHNQMGALAGEPEKERFRRSLVVMLYAHLEGFCKVAFTIYVDAINREALTIAQGTSILGASAMWDVFGALENADRKNKVFRAQLPADDKLHVLSRRKDFLDDLVEFEKRPLKLEADTVVSTESNLKPVVLRKLLYIVGLDPTLADPCEGGLHLLLNKRNAIAHGSERAGIASTVYTALETTVSEIVRRVILAIYAATVTEQHLRNP